MSPKHNADTIFNCIRTYFYSLRKKASQIEKGNIVENNKSKNVRQR
jgi:hypothetical protein